MKQLNILFVFISTACLYLAGVPQAKAASACAITGNLVANCGFEIGTFSGWTLSGADVPAQLNNLYGVEGTDPADGIAPHSGSFQAYFADLTTSPITLSQSVLTTAGSTYTISFYLAQDTDPTSGGSTYTDSLSASFAGSTLLSSTVVPAKGYTKYSFSGVATGSVSVLSLTFGNDLGEFVLDDVTVAAPEPAAWSLMAGGALLALLFRRKAAGNIAR